MIQRSAATLAVVALVALSYPLASQTTRPVTTPAPSASSSQNLSSPALSSTGASPATALSQSEPGTNGPAATTPDLPAPHITIATPAPAPAPWPWQQRISWAADLVLVAMAYVGIMMGVSLLKKIEKQGQLVEDAAQAAASSARAALLLADAKNRSERPWILMSVRPAIGADNVFSIVATNRGRGPAKVVATVEEIVCAVDDKALSAFPTFTKEPSAPQEQVILLPDETFELIAFSRDDVSQVSETEERLKRIEDWEEKIYLYGKVIYRDLTAPDDAAPFESSWMCWYIHGRQKSGMVMAGPPSYNVHT